MYICNKCDNLVDELPIVRESRGEFWGAPCFEAYEDNECSCGGYYDEAVRCESCGNYFAEEEGNDFGICRECKDDALYKFNTEFSETERNFILWHLG